MSETAMSVPRAGFGMDVRFQLLWTNTKEGNSWRAGESRCGFAGYHPHVFPSAVASPLQQCMVVPCSTAMLAFGGIMFGVPPFPRVHIGSSRLSCLHFPRTHDGSIQEYLLMSSFPIRDLFCFPKQDFSV